MALWGRGPSSRRLGILIWIVVLLFLYRHYPFPLSNVLYPTREGPTARYSDAKKWSSRIRPVDEKALGSSGSGFDSTKYFVQSGYDWSKLRRRHPIPESDMSKPPQGPPKPLKRVQHAFHRAAFTLSPKQQAQVDSVRDAFKRCWDSYIEHAFPHDELTPLSLEGKDTFGSWAATMVDALDTLWIMGLYDEFYSVLPAVGAIDWEDTPLASVNVFETTIRYLGGLLSAYDLSGEKVLLLKATELGEMLYVAFDTPNHMPPFVWPPKPMCSLVDTSLIASSGWTSVRQRRALNKLARMILLLRRAHSRSNSPASPS